MFQPARLKSAIVESCRLPFGSPRRSLLATVHLHRVCERERLRKAAHRAFMANQAIALHNHSKEQGIVVAICSGRDDTQAIAARLALHPELLPRPAPECQKP